MDLQPLGDRLIVEPLEEEETTSSGIVLPDTAKEKPQRGRVLAVGPGARNDKGEMDLRAFGGGWKTPSGSFGRPSIEPKIPTRRSSLS